MTTDRRFPGSSQQSPDPASPAPVEDMPGEDLGPPTEDDTPPPQDWKHPDDGKSLSERDIEIPLKP
ncbi:hypothetical protein [Pseudomonas sp. NA-150]|uniref:hypothetical protein n=1 Tax=Pseudomonas sp. NA-150 TaxID=3367525 RepID=UPI0037C709A8